MIKTRKFSIILLFIIAVLTALCGGVLLIDNQQTASAHTIIQSSLPNQFKVLFTDYTMTALNEQYDTVEELEDFKKTVGASSDYEKYIKRAEDIINGNISYDGMREFSTKQDAANKIDQFGNMQDYMLNTLKWQFITFDLQVTGLYAMDNETVTIYVDAAQNARIPYLYVAQAHGYYNNYLNGLVLRPGINTFTFSRTEQGDGGGPIYFYNPYTPSTQNGDVSIYFEGGRFYPVYKSGDDEDVFIKQLKEYEERRKKGQEKLDFAELLPDRMLITTTSSSLYNAYATRNASPEENLELWSNYMKQAFEFCGIATGPESEFAEHYNEMTNNIRINYRYMTQYPNSGAYTHTRHIGYYYEHDLLADFNTTSMSDTHYFRLGHELGHALDNTTFLLNETTNNVVAGFTFSQIMGKHDDQWVPYTKTIRKLSSDYTLDFSAYDDGYIRYTNPSNYDHNYLIWWDLESVFPGYYGRLNNYYRYTASPLTGAEQMVYFSSLATGVDLSEYFERWGYYPGSSSADKFKINNTSAIFKALMEQAKKQGKVKKAYSHFWYVDISQYEFSENHANVSESEREYQGGTPSILYAGMYGKLRTLNFSTPTDENFLGYEVLSTTDGNTYKLIGFTDSLSFTDTNDYGSIEPQYKIRAINRFFHASEDSASKMVDGRGAIDLSECQIHFDGEFIYDGHAKTPQITVTHNGDTVSSQNYTVSYKNNIDAGTATISVLSKGMLFMGSQSATFVIKPYELTASEIIVSGFKNTILYTGSETSQSIKLFWNGITVSNNDYTIEYIGDKVDVGTVQMKIVYRGNFCGEYSLFYDIVPAYYFKLQALYAIDLSELTGTVSDYELLGRIKIAIEAFTTEELNSLSESDKNKVADYWACVNSWNEIVDGADDVIKLSENVADSPIKGLFESITVLSLLGAIAAVGKRFFI